MQANHEGAGQANNLRHAHLEQAEAPEHLHTPQQRELPAARAHR